MTNQFIEPLTEATTVTTANDKILNAGFEDVIIFDNPSYDTALVAVTTNNEAVYDYDKMIEYLVQHDGMNYEEAADFISYNSSYSYGNGYPIIIYSLEDE